MCSFQDRSDATERPNLDILSHMRVFDPMRMSGRFLFSRLETGQIKFLVSHSSDVFWSRVIELFRLFGTERVPCRVLSSA